MYTNLKYTRKVRVRLMLQRQDAWKNSSELNEHISYETFLVIKPS